ncbi:MAG: hypothetical protein P4L40_13185 [Terracidiphilus sp.]|nr:hypothetical protein [Terracidiphilus sp.]
MPEEDVVTIRLPRERARFLGLNLSTLLQRTYDAMEGNGQSTERRDGLARRALALAAIDDAVRGALLEEEATAQRRMSAPAWQAVSDDMGQTQQAQAAQ